MERKINRVGIYVRKSREEETEDMIKRQLAALVDHCKKNEWEYEVFMEVGSSQDLDRPELQKMLEKVKMFYFDGVVIADLDRLSRNTIHFGLIKEVFISANCLAITLAKTYDFSKNDDDFMSDIQSVLSKQEYQTIKRRLVRGARQSAKDGNYMGKKVPVGYVYNKETKRLVKSEDAPIIRRMFEEYANGLSTKDIAYKFTFEDVFTTKGIIWTPSGVSRLLNNIVYVGDSLYGKTTNKNGKRSVKTNKEEQILVKDTHEPIIDRELWDRVQRIKAERNSRPLSLRLAKHTFSGLIRCGLCGSIHSFQTSRYKRKRINSCQTRNYITNDMDKYEVCKNKGCNLTEFEDIFYKLLSEYTVELEKYVDVIRNSETKASNVTTEDEIKSKERQIKKIQQEIKRVQNGYKMEIFTEQEAHEEIKKYRKQHGLLENEIEELKKVEEDDGIDYLQSTLDKLKGFLSNRHDIPETEANDILKDFVETIIYVKTDEDNNEIDMKVVWKDVM